MQTSRKGTEGIMERVSTWRKGNQTWQTTAHGELRHLSGNTRPYFSLTGEVRRIFPAANDCAECGQLHGRLLRIWPDMADLAALHLADDDGKPMHAEDNGWYWLAGYLGGMGETYHGSNGSDGRTKEDCLRIFAEHVRVPHALAEELAQELAALPPTESKAKFGEWVKSQEARWKSEAQAAIKKYGLEVQHS